MQTKFVRLTDAQSEVIKEFLNWQRKRKLNLRNVFDAIQDITRTGVQWRNLPIYEYPDWEAVYYYFGQWKKNGTIEKINLALNAIERK
jgi:transposase